MAEEKVPYDSSDRASVKERNSQLKTALANRKDGLRRMLEDPFCRAYIWELIGFCNVFQTTMTGNSYTYFNEGMRNVGLKVLADVKNVDPKFLIQMMTENGEKNEHNV